MRVPGEAALVLGRLVGAEVVEEEEGIELRHLVEAEGPPQVNARALDCRLALPDLLGPTCLGHSSALQLGIHRARLASHRTQGPGRWIAGRKGISEHLVDLILSSRGRLPRRHQRRVSVRHSARARRAHHARWGPGLLPSTIGRLAMGLGGAIAVPGPLRTGPPRARRQAAARAERSSKGWSLRCRGVGGCRDVGRLQATFWRPLYFCSTHRS